MTQPDRAPIDPTAHLPHGSAVHGDVYPELARTVTAGEFARAVELARAEGLERLDDRVRARW